jgi:hypothetical protein
VITAADLCTVKIANFESIHRAREQEYVFEVYSREYYNIVEQRLHENSGFRHKR